MTRPGLSVAGLALALLAAPGGAAKLAVTGGRVVTMAGRTWDPGVVLVEDGRITAVGGAELDVPPGYQVLDAAGARVLPGLIDANTHLGLVEVDMEPTSKELGKISDADGARLRAADGVFPGSELIPVTRLNGITTVLVSPGEQGIFSGQGAVLDLAGATLRDMLVKDPATLHVSLGASGSSGKPYSTRMSRMAHLRAAFLDAQAYERKRVRYQEELADFETERAAEASAPTTGEAESETPKRPPLPPGRDLEKEALGAALRGEVPVFFRAHRADDILRALEVAEEFGLRAVINHGTEAHLVAAQLAAADVPVVVGPINQQPSSFETLRASYQNAARLHAAGVRLAIQTGGAHNVRNLPFMAGLAVAHGLPRAVALEAVTIEAARILGVADELGSLEAGKAANLIVVEGDVFQPRSKLRTLVIGGEVVPLVSKQTRLRDRFDPAR